MASRSARSKHELVSTPAATRAFFMSPMDTLSPLDARARSAAPRTRRASVNAGADRAATRDLEIAVGAGRIAEGTARAAARDRGTEVAGAARHVAIVAEIIPASRMRACDYAAARMQVPRKPSRNSSPWTTVARRPRNPAGYFRKPTRIDAAARSVMSRAFIVASTSSGLVAPGRAPRTRHSGPNPVALKPIGRSPAYAPSLKKKEDDVGGSRNKPGIARLFGGGNSDMKAKVAQLEYELENERAHASELGGKLRAVEGELAKVKDSLDLYKGRCKEQEKEIFKLEKKNEETQRGFDTGMAVAKKQIKYLEELLEEEKRKNQ